MKYLVFTDNHFCQYSSILRSRGSKYSIRLENQIQSLNWVFEQARSNNVDRIISLGDFFDNSSLNTEEITALSEIQFPDDIPMTFLVGNHEMWKNDLSCSSSHLFSLIPNTQIISTPCVLDGVGYLPYILESNRSPLREYFPQHIKYVFSHNDISGINYGGHFSQSGFSVKEIKECCDFFINGHIHNEGLVEETIINLGNLTGLNFSEDAFKYRHRIMILDTNSEELSFFNNPHALNFYKLNNPLKIETANNIITIKCKEDKLDEVKQWLTSVPEVIDSRIVVEYNKAVEENSSDTFAINYLEEFKNFVYESIGTSEIIKIELEKILSNET